MFEELDILYLNACLCHDFCTNDQCSGENKPPFWWKSNIFATWIILAVVCIHIKIVQLYV